MIRSSLRRIVTATATVAVTTAAIVSSPAGAALGDAEPATPAWSAGTGCAEHTDSVFRLYTAGLGRTPERGGMAWWVDQYRAENWTLQRMADHFVVSDEFRAVYEPDHPLSNVGFIQQLYVNVLGRFGEESGISFWLDQMVNHGVTRGEVLLRFAESPENIDRSGTVEPAAGPFSNGVPRSDWGCDPAPLDVSDGIDAPVVVPEPEPEPEPGPPGAPYDLAVEDPDFGEFVDNWLASGGHGEWDWACKSGDPAGDAFRRIGVVFQSGMFPWEMLRPSEMPAGVVAQMRFTQSRERWLDATVERYCWEQANL